MTRAPHEDRSNPVRMALEQALELTEQGLPCFPCNAKKEPLCKHGFKRATKDADELRQLWQGAWQPAVRIGVATGEASGLFCLDVDSGKKPEAVQWHERMLPQLPQTRLHKTESGGWHYLFQHQAGLALSRRARSISASIPAAMVDTSFGGRRMSYRSSIASCRSRQYLSG